MKYSGVGVMRGRLRIVLISGILLVTGALLAQAILSPRPNSGLKGTEDAPQIADAVLQRTCRALAQYRTRQAWTWNEILTRCSVLPTDAESLRAAYLEARQSRAFTDRLYDYTMPGSHVAPAPDDPDAFIGVTRPWGEAGFFVIVRDNEDDDDPLSDSDDTLVVLVTVTLPDGGQARLEATVAWREALHTSEKAVLASGDLDVTGSPSIEGGTHVRHAFVFDSPTIDIESTGLIRVNGSPSGSLQHRALERPVPEIEPEDYAALADVRLDRRGLVLARDGRRLHDAREGRAWEGLRWSPTSGWSTRSTGRPLAIFVEGDLALVGPIDRSITVFATGSIAVNGSARLTPAIGETLLVAGGDVLLTGPSNARLEGLVAAREQVSLFGSFEMDGSILARNADDLHALVTRSGDGRPASAVRLGGHVRLRLIPGRTTILRGPGSGVVVLSLARPK